LGAALNAISKGGLGLVHVEKGWQQWVPGMQDGKGYMHKVPTLIHLTPQFTGLVKDAGLRLDDFRRSERKEVIVLRAKKQKGKKGEDIEYPDTPWTRQAQQRLQEINAWLAGANIEAPFGVDTSSRYLRRIFNNSSFEDGGRLYDGFWQALSKSERRSIKIEGER